MVDLHYTCFNCKKVEFFYRILLSYSSLDKVRFKCRNCTLIYNLGQFCIASSLPDVFLKQGPCRSETFVLQYVMSCTSSVIYILQPNKHYVSFQHQTAEVQRIVPSSIALTMSQQGRKTFARLNQASRYITHPFCLSLFEYNQMFIQNGLMLFLVWHCMFNITKPCLCPVLRLKLCMRRVKEAQAMFS